MKDLRWKNENHCHFDAKFDDLLVPTPIFCQKVLFVRPLIKLRKGSKPLTPARGIYHWVEHTFKIKLRFLMKKFYDLSFWNLSSNFLLICLMLASFLLLQTHAGAMLTSVDLESVSLLTKMDQLVHTSPVRKIVGSCTYLMIEHGFWNLTKISWKNIKIGHSKRDSDVFSWNVFIFDNLHSHSAQSICCRRANFESSHHRANTSSRPSNDFWRKVHEKREIWSQIWCFSQKLIKNLKQYLGVNCFAVG